ncbi:MAG: bifunctional o-acetylhomoserine/o-acetylserine sulfhydrylase [Acidimicrobiia bacterium]
MSDNWGFETKQIHSGAAPDPATGARATPIYQTTSYQFRDSQHAANLFALAEFGNIYTRLMNPTQGVFETRVAALEGGVGALATSSGQAAETLSILNLAETGDHIVASAALYGGTYNLLHYTLPKMGVNVTFINDPDDLDAWAKAVQPNTRAFFAETLPNPKNMVLDTEGVAKVAHDNGVPLIVDNTVPTPYLYEPIKWGADVVVHSATKFIGGHGTSIAGVIVDAGSFDWGAGRHPMFTEPDPSYHGLQYWQALGNQAFHLKARVQGMRDIGAAISPFNAFLLIQGLETLSLRMERHVSNAQKVAEFLESRSDVKWVAYAGLKSSPWYAAGQKYMPRGQGSIIAFGIDGGAAAGSKFVDALQLHSHVANIGDVRSLAIHPATTTHSQLTADEQISTGVSPDMIRLSVGIESIEDILADLEVGFAAAKQ